MAIDHKALIKQLSKEGLAALDGAVTHAVREKNPEITLTHFVWAALRVESSDVRGRIMHVVELGESLVDIARYYACDVEDIATDNAVPIDFQPERGKRVVVRPLLSLMPILDPGRLPRA